MTFTIDTSAYSAFNRGDKRLRAWFNSKNEIMVPTIVVGELWTGFAAGSKQQENEDLLQRFIDSPNVSVVTITDKTTRIYADIYLKLREKGRPIGTNDMWIASIALEQNNQLLTTDKDFANVSGLMLATI
jgi:tRNA(fMet)-specific endonuclease VapC